MGPFRSRRPEAEAIPEPVERDREETLLEFSANALQCLTDGWDPYDIIEQTVVTSNEEKRAVADGVVFGLVTSGEYVWTKKEQALFQMWPARSDRIFENVCKILLDKHDDIFKSNWPDKDKNILADEVMATFIGLSTKSAEDPLAVQVAKYGQFGRLLRDTYVRRDRAQYNRLMVKAAEPLGIKEVSFVNIEPDVPEPAQEVYNPTPTMKERRRVNWGKATRSTIYGASTVAAVAGLAPAAAAAPQTTVVFTTELPQAQMFNSSPASVNMTLPLEVVSSSTHTESSISRHGSYAENPVDVSVPDEAIGDTITGGVDTTKNSDSRDLTFTGNPADAQNRFDAYMQKQDSVPVSGGEGTLGALVAARLADIEKSAPSMPDEVVEAMTLAHGSSTFADTLDRAANGDAVILGLVKNTSAYGSDNFRVELQNTWPVVMDELKAASDLSQFTERDVKLTAISIAIAELGVAEQAETGDDPTVPIDTTTYDDPIEPTEPDKGNNPDNGNDPRDPDKNDDKKKDRDPQREPNPDKPRDPGGDHDPDKKKRFDALLDVISKFEGGDNYNAYYGNGGNTEIDFTSMSVGEVLAWQREFVADGSPSSAVGRYQYLQDTLRGLMERYDIPMDTHFNKRLQDRLAVYSLEGRKLQAYLDGDIGPREFAHNLSMEWASLPQVIVTKAKNPNPSASYYAGDGLNNAHISIPEILRAIKSIKVNKDHGGETLDNNKAAQITRALYREYQAWPENETDNDNSNSRIAKYTEGRLGPEWAWCSFFATYVLNDAGVDVPRFGLVSDLYNWMEDDSNKDFYVYTMEDVRNGKTTVQPGDVIFYNQSGNFSALPGSGSNNHVGIVYKAHGDRFTSIDGNWDDQVNMHKTSTHDPIAMAIGRYIG